MILYLNKSNREYGKIITIQAKGIRPNLIDYES